MSSAPDDPGDDAIVHAVWQVMADGGIHSVSMRRVAAAADTSVGRIQYRYRTKDALVRASLQAMLDRAAATHEAATVGVTDWQALWHLVRHSIARSPAARTGVSVFHQYVAAAAADPTLSAMLAEAKAGQEAEVARLITRIAPDVRDPRTRARALVAAADGLAMRVLIGGVSAAAAERTLRVELERAVTA